MNNVLELALEALNVARGFCNSFSAEECPDTVAFPIFEAIAALKEAIKQQGEPVVYWNGMGAIVPAQDVSYLPNWEDYYPIPLFRCTSAPSIPEGYLKAAEACTEFVRKVESGNARSYRSYTQMKEALGLIAEYKGEKS